MFEGGALSGPWDQGFWFEVPFTMRSKSNFRRGQRSRDWNTQSAFASDLAVLAHSALPDGWDPGSADQPVSSRPTMAVVIVARSVLDTANLSKSVLDAMESPTIKGAVGPAPLGVYVNDAQVRFQSSLSERGRNDQRGLVAVCRLTPDVSLEDLARAGAQLTTEALAHWS